MTPDDRHIPGLFAPRLAARFVGVCCLVFAILGLLYTVMTSAAVLGMPADDQAPYVAHFFVGFTLLTIAIDVLLLICGVSLLRLKTQVRQYLTLACGAAIIACLGIIPLWTLTSPALARSAGAATGMGLGGLSVLLFTLFPLWAPPLVYWAHNRLYTQRARRLTSGLCAHCGHQLAASQSRCPECGLDMKP